MCFIPIDRIADDRGQALREWITNKAVLMQPFQYDIWLIFGSFDVIMIKSPTLTAIAFYLLGKSIKVAKSITNKIKQRNRPRFRWSTKSRANSIWKKRKY